MSSCSWWNSLTLAECLINSGDREHFFVVTEDLLRLLNDFYRRPVVKTLAAEHGLDSMYWLTTWLWWCVLTDNLKVTVCIDWQLDSDSVYWLTTWQWQYVLTDNLKETVCVDWQLDSDSVYCLITWQWHWQCVLTDNLFVTVCVDWQLDSDSVHWLTTWQWQCWHCVFWLMTG